MTTYNHTPFSTSARTAATGALFNAVFSDLDAAIGNLTGLSTSAKSDLVAALNEIKTQVDIVGTAASGVAATTANEPGGLLAGANEIIVDDVTGFVEDAYIVYPDSGGGGPEYNEIASVNVGASKLLLKSATGVNIDDGALIAMITIDQVLAAGNYDNVPDRIDGIDGLPGSLRLAAALIPTTFSIDLRSGGDLKVGNWIALSPFTSACELRRINSISGVTIGVTALANSHAKDSAVLWFDSEPRYTPELFGAKGDGSTDDTTAIQAAIDAASTGVVEFANRTYKITTTLTPRGRTTFRGASKQGTVIYAVGCNGITFAPGSSNPDNYYFTVRDMTIRGDYTASKVGISLFLAHRFSIENVLIENFSSHGVALLDNVYVGTIDRLTVLNCDGDGLNIGEICTAITVNQSQFLNNNGAGIRILGSGSLRSYQILINGCMIELNKDSGIVADWANAVSIIGCYIERNAHVNTGAGRTNTSTPGTGYNVRFGSVSTSTVRGATIKGSWFTRAIEDASTGNGYHIAFGDGSSAGATDIDIDGNSFDSNDTTKALLFNSNMARIVVSPANRFESGFTTAEVVSGVAALNGTTGVTVNHNFNNTGYMVSITPTASIAGRLYVTKNSTSFLIKSTDAGDTGNCDYVVTRHA